MHFDYKKPCNNCPFLREGGIRLTKERAEEIAGYFIEEPGATFACHKTTVDTEDDETGLSRRVSTRNSQMCAGGLIFAIKQDCFNNMLRIAGRLQIFKPDRYDEGELVFDSLEEMLDANNE